MIWDVENVLCRCDMFASFFHFNIKNAKIWGFQEIITIDREITLVYCAIVIAKKDCVHKGEF